MIYIILLIPRPIPLNRFQNLVSLFLFPRLRHERQITKDYMESHKRKYEIDIFMKSFIPIAKSYKINHLGTI